MTPRASQTNDENAAAQWAANPGCSRLSAGFLPSTQARSWPKSRLKGGCGQDCPPHAYFRGRLRLVHPSAARTELYIARTTVWMVISTLSLTRRKRVLGFFMPHST